MSEFYITPQKVTEYISFDRNDHDCVYDNTSNSIRNKQTEGVAYIWNLLQRYGIALLADEVGMGKTLQAIGICTLLWNINPDATVLVIAPNETLVNNWINEYNCFINEHYKKSDDIVKTSIGNKPINKPFYSRNIKMLVKEINKGWCHFFIAKTSSFSWILNNKKAAANKVNANKEGIRLRECINKKIDLLIIDEAHYYRNPESGSLRTASSLGFFSKINYIRNEDRYDYKNSSNIADKILLLTATPNHTHPSNINNIVKYFNYNLSQRDTNDILSEIGLRRFRRLTESGKMKYNYRSENIIKSNFKSDPNAELFYAMYTKKLVDHCTREKKRFLFGYLEGFESIPFSRTALNKTNKYNTITEESEENQSDDSKTDFNKTDDTEILQNLHAKYKEVIKNKKFIPHPKYDDLIYTLYKKITNYDSLNEKCLVFVRRIPSVFEISARLIDKYDKLFWSEINNTLSKLKNNKMAYKKTRKIPTRKKYIKMFQELDSDTNDDDMLVENIEIESSDEIPQSKIFNLFTTKKNEKATHASLFRNRFVKKDDLFSIFFQPALDYFDKTYNFNNSNIVRDDNKNVFYFTAANARLQKILKNTKQENEKSQANFLVKKYFSYEKLNNESDKQEQIENYENLFSIFFSKVKDNKIISKYKKLSILQKEAFSNYIQKGILFASSALIEIYNWFLQAQFEYKNKINKGKELYNKFIKRVKKDIDGSLTFKYICEAIDNFEIYTEKVLGVSDKEKLLSNTIWNHYNNQNPAYPACGKITRRERIIKAFNSPFFPDIVISTSVLQEGVNMQYYCSQVIHYGIAWTPGDNEQRNGRIDRMFGQIERNLIKDENSTLNIYYPYLEKTLDENQVKQFLIKKYIAENLLDSCQLNEDNKEINEKIETIDIDKYLRKPVDIGHIKDPFESKGLNNKNQFKPKQHYVKKDFINELISKINAAVKKLKYESKISNIYNEDEKQKRLCIIDPKIVRNDKIRNQPVFIELNFDSEFSGLENGTIYYITLYTPITKELGFKYDNILNLYSTKVSKYPMVQLCNDKEENKTSYFYYYMKVDLPLFRFKNYISLLSDEEIKIGLENLIDFADEFEIELFKLKEQHQDLSIKDLNINFKESESHIFNNDEIHNAVSDNCEWNILNNCYYLKEKVNIGNNNMLQLNNCYPFIYFYKTEKGCYMQLSYPEIDFQAEEMNILSKWFNYVKGEIFDLM